MKKQFLIIDGLNLVRRLYAALAKEEDPARRVERTFSTSIDALARLLAQFQPQYAVAVFDGEGQTWRHRLYPDYKLGRVPMDDVLYEALPQLAKAFRHNRVPALRLSDWEADDLIATLAVKAAQKGIQSFIISTDKGFTQLLSNPSIRQYDYFAKQGYDADWVRAKYGVGAEQLTDYWSLTGDTTNRIPGVHGIGPKTAAAILSQQVGIEHIYDNLDSFEHPVRERLSGKEQSCYLSRQLVTLKQDVEVGVKLSQLKVSKPLS